MRACTPRSAIIFLSCFLFVALCDGAAAKAVSNPQPYIASFTPIIGPVGTVISVTGSGFTGLTAAWIGAAHDATVVVVSNTQAKITVPKDATQGQVAVLNQLHAAFSPASFTVTATVASAQPYISSFTPSSGPVGTLITVTGSGFTGLTAAWIGAAHDATVVVVRKTQAKITVPKDATQGQVAVLNPLHAAFSPASFTVTKPVVYAQPTISSFTPISGMVGTVITVTGSGFTGLTSAWVGTAHDAAVSVISDSQASVTVPADAVSGVITLLNPLHSAATSPSFTVSTVVTYAQPVISSFTPGSGTVGTEIELKGSGFTGITAAWVGNGHDASFQVLTDTMIEVVVPADGTSGPIKLLNPQHSVLSATSYTVTPSGGNTALSMRVLGNDLVDQNGLVLQLRGVNVSGLEFVAVQGWSPADPWGGSGQAPNFAAIKTWKANAVRFPLNEASWLGYMCADYTGALRDPDPGHNYQATVKKAVADATAAGLYVSIDLHWSAPKNFCPLAQNPMADADNSIRFWTSIANTFKGYPNVEFTLFNEPFFYYMTDGEVDWDVLMHGGTLTQYITGDGGHYTVNYTWQTAGMQQLIDAVRATGATNVVMVGGVSFAQDLSQWIAYRPNDPLGQMGAAWHAYPNSGTVGDPQAALPKFGNIAYTWMQSVVDAGYPVFISEFGDHNAPGTVGSPFVSVLLPKADALKLSYIGWSWDVWQNQDNILIKDSTGTPTDGYGVYVKAHYLCVAAGTANCP
ncbi:MAG: cellulase family glycosylhydrolase [Gammaproteobacteria bacterium]